MENKKLELIGLKNTASQTVLTGGSISAGPSYRQYSKTSCGIRTFVAANGGATIQKEGIYHVTAVLVGTGTAAGDVTVQLALNGTPIDGAISTQSVTTAGTEIRTFVIDYYVLINDADLLGVNTVPAGTLTLQNTGVGATFTNVVLNVTREV